MKCFNEHGSEQVSAEVTLSVPAHFRVYVVPRSVGDETQPVRSAISERVELDVYVFGPAPDFDLGARV